ncbi:MAG: hypothetical protein KDD11_18135, partial [Acidobacteria bacterium]|nr:hypothetical protein [Acidobacteriota bacterium]
MSASANCFAARNSVRIDQQVQIRGFRVELGEIETALARLPEVAEAAVCAVPGTGGERLVAYAVAKPGAAPSLETLRAALRDRLPEYMVPAQLVLLESLPTNPNGKIDREALVRATPAPGSGPVAVTAASVAPAATTADQRRTRDEIARVWAEVLGLESVDPDTSFFDLGGHSLLVGEVVDRLEASLRRPLKAVDVFHFPTVRSLAEHLAPAAEEGVVAGEPRGAGLAPSEPIAIIGIAGRFPGATSLDDFWDHLCAGDEAVSFFSDEELAASGVPAEERRRPDYVPAAAVLDGVEDFDAGFFGFSPREAEILDPQQRLFLECAWHALEDGGCEPGPGAGRVGVFAGLTQSTYWSRHLATHPELVAAVGDYQLTLANDKDFLPTRVSYKLDLQGPSINVQTACSTS